MSNQSQSTSVAHPVLKVAGASLSFGQKTLWQDLNLAIAPGEFVAVLGTNGSGKTTLLKAILGQQALDAGSIEISGKPIGHGSRDIGYIPQHRSVDAATPLLARDLLTLGLNGHRFGFRFGARKDRERVNHILGCIDGFDLARKPIGELSGGELQRFRVGQAVIDEPDLILADEPLSALDPAQQKIIADLLDQERKEHSAAVLFVTHDVNPILPMVDRVLYLANGQYRIGTPEEVMRSEVLSELYQTEIDVVRNQGRIVVIGTHSHHHHPDEEWG